MQTTLLIAVTAGLLGMIGWGCADFFAKKTIDRIGDLATLFWGQILGLIPLLLLFFLWRPSVPSLSVTDPLALLVFGAISALSYLLLYRGFELGKVSVLSPVFASYGGVAVLISALVFGEAVPVLRWVALAVIFAGILLMSIDLGDLKKSWRLEGRLHGLFEVLCAMLVFSVWLVLWGHYVDARNWIFYVIIMRAIAALTLLVVAGIKHEHLWFKDRSLWLPLVLIGGFDVLAYAAVTWGFGATSLTGTIALLSGAFSLPTLILARIFLKERLNMAQTVAALTIIIGVALVSVSA
jgi:drug/metabolite transporter (DMT)-like permease